ncbi:MAG: hypothetical protein JO050_01965, partial [Acidimicrobiia bacterium]|nr:hypothetical protein [Acidimicrobiia bacterium]
MKAGMARQSALASVAALVGSLVVPHVAAVATAAGGQPKAAAQTAPQTPTRPHDAAWSPASFDIRKLRRTLQAAPQSSSSSTTRGYQGTNPPNPCYYSIWDESDGDAPQLDAVSYGALYDCPSGTWTFVVNTQNSWATSALDFFDIPIDTDNNPNDGCSGFDYILDGSLNASGSLQATLYRTTDCNTATPVASGGIARSNTSDLAMAIPNSALGNPPNIRWFGAIQGVNDANPDYFPEPSGGLQPVHQEDGYTGSGCTVGFASNGQPESYSLVDDPRAAAAVLQADGQPGVTVDGAGGSASGIVRFSGDPARAGATLGRHGIKANVSPDFVRHYQVAPPNDPDLGQQWSLNAVNAQGAWNVTTGSASIVVAD